jgi:RimJ/RimL family protein N-acetyltransferase
MEIKFNDIIIGKYIILKKMGLDDALDVYNWRTSVSGNFMRQPEEYSLDSQLNWIKCRSEYEINYIIFDRITNKKVGTIGIYDVNCFDKITNVGRLLLGDEYLGLSNPYGLEALLLCFDYVFNELNFRKITGDILASNLDMYKFQVFLGMKQEGYLEKHVIIKGIEEDIFIMSLFQEVFFKKYRGKLLFLLKSFANYTSF